MRPERITLQQAQRCYDSIQAQIKLAPSNGACVELPHIDMAGIFAGRKSMTWQAVTAAVKTKLAEVLK